MNRPINPVLRLTPELRRQRLLASFTHRDRVRQSTRHAGEWLVSSSTHPNAWYRVKYNCRTREYSCGCEWHQRTKTACRHLVRISWEVGELKKQGGLAERQAVRMTYAAAD